MKISPSLLVFFVSMLVIIACQAPPQKKSPLINKEAPGFTLVDSNEKERNLFELKGKNVLLVFYRGSW